MALRIPVILLTATAMLVVMTASIAVTSDNQLEITHLPVTNTGEHGSGIENRRMQVVNTHDGLQFLRAEHFALHAEYPPLPDIDFARQNLVAVFAGKSFPGHSIEIAGAYEYNEFVDVVIAETVRNECMAEDSKVQTHEFAIIPVSGKPVYFTHIISYADRESESC